MIRNLSSGNVFTADSKAKQLLQKIVGLLERLEQLQVPSPLESDFILLFYRLLSDIDQYLHKIIQSSKYSVTCSRGCSTCCFHWVEDVNSFESIIIADYLKKKYPKEINRIYNQCSEDRDELLHLEKLVSEKLSQQKVVTAKNRIDAMDLLLHVFYQMRRPCPLLSEQGDCLIYPIRPLTCRMYVSISDPQQCDPDYINHNKLSTCLITLNKKADVLIDHLHKRYTCDEINDTSLRSQLLQYLQ